MSTRPRGPEGQQRPTFIEVDHAALRHNLDVICGKAAPCVVHAVVKANAYGHGMLEVARTLCDAGVAGLCTALVEEALALRGAGLRVPLLVMNGVYGSSHALVLAQGLTPVVHHVDDLRAFAAVAQEPVGFHLKLDTGMARLGVPIRDLAAVLDVLERLPKLRLEGLMTHLSSADTDDHATAAQYTALAQAHDQLVARGHAPRFVHAGNSAAVFKGLPGDQTLVRAGIALYGVQPFAGANLDLRPVMRLSTHVVAVRELPVGAPVGYDQSYRTRRPSRIATIPIGYGDGILRSGSNRAHALVGGLRCRLVGRVSMDLCTLDVTDVGACAVGDEVVLLGAQGQVRHDAADLATECDTNAYEVLTQLSARLPRVHLPG